MTNQDLFMLTPEEREELRKREREVEEGRIGPAGECGPVGHQGCPGAQGPEAPHGVWIRQVDKIYPNGMAPIVGLLPLYD